MCVDKQLRHFPKFTGVKNYLHLDLRRNRITYVPLLNGIQFQTVDLRDNPLNCSTLGYFSHPRIIQNSCNLPATKGNYTHHNPKTGNRRIIDTKLHSHIEGKSLNTSPTITIALSSTGAISLCVFLSVTFGFCAKRKWDSNQSMSQENDSKEICMDMNGVILTDSETQPVMLTTNMDTGEPMDTEQSPPESCSNRLTVDASRPLIVSATVHSPPQEGLQGAASLHSPPFPNDTGAELPACDPGAACSMTRPVDDSTTLPEDPQPSPMNQSTLKRPRPDWGCEGSRYSKDCKKAKSKKSKNCSLKKRPCDSHDAQDKGQEKKFKKN